LEEGYLTKVLTVLTNPMNEVLAGYLHQILENLATHRIKEVKTNLMIQFLEYFQANPQQMELMFKLASWTSISSCLTLFLKIDPDEALNCDNLPVFLQRNPSTNDSRS
jgi:hypothetical protein